MKMLERFDAARRASAPLIAINTPDPKQTIESIMARYGQPPKKNKEPDRFTDRPIVQWDIVRGAVAWNIPGNEMLAKSVGGQLDNEGKMTSETADMLKDKTGNPVGMLELAMTFYGDADLGGAILFILNAYRYLENPAVAQAIWNLRDEYKSNNRTLVLLSPELKLPIELKTDFVVIDEPYPTDKELETIITRVHNDAGLKIPENGALQKAVDAVAGLAAFPAEQSVAMALTRKGIDSDILGAQKRQQVASVQGASIWPGKETFGDVVGCRNIVSFLNQLLTNPRERFRLIFFLDELEKMVAGSGDTSGVSQAMNEQFLAWSQNSKALGLILLGVPGAGKSLVSKAAAGQFELPCFMASLSKVKGSLVGESERNAAQLFKTADAIAAGGRILMIATCNQVGALTPEMQARFRLGTVFFDYPDEEQNAALWEFYRARYGITDTAIPPSKNWVGREIESCCELAYLLDTPLKDAAKRIVPVSQAKAVEIEKLKQECSGRFISADYDGIYKYDKAVGGQPLGAQTSGRAIKLEG